MWLRTGLDTSARGARPKVQSKGPCPWQLCLADLAERPRPHTCDPPGWAMLAAIPCNCACSIGNFDWPLQQQEAAVCLFWEHGATPCTTHHAVLTVAQVRSVRAVNVAVVSKQSRRGQQTISGATLPQSAPRRKMLSKLHLPRAALRSSDHIILSFRQHALSHAALGASCCCRVLQVCARQQPAALEAVDLEVQAPPATWLKPHPASSRHPFWSEYHTSHPSAHAGAPSTATYFLLVRRGDVFEMHPASAYITFKPVVVRCAFDRPP